MKSYFLKLYTYNLWANANIVSFVHESNMKEGEIIKLISHILNAEYVWYSRVTGRKEFDRNIWGVFKIEELELQVQEAAQLYKELLENLKEEELGKLISYVNSKGNSYTNTIEDILTQVNNHSNYHRAQVTKLLRQSNLNPPSTDFISYLREGK